MSENNNKPIPSPFSPYTISDAFMDELEMITKKHGYNNFFVVLHRKKEGSFGCEMVAGSSFQSECLLEYLEQTIDNIENSLKDLDNKG